MLKQLSPSTKELIYYKIKECEQEIRMIEKRIESANEETSMNAEFLEFYYIERDLLRKQIEDLKQMLFTR